MSDEVPLLPIQEWFFWKYSPAPNHWNQTFSIETPLLDLNKLKDSLIKLIDYHDAFKYRYVKNDNQKYIQYYDDSIPSETAFSFNVLDIGSLDQDKNQQESLNDVLTRWQSHFDIEKGPLCAVAYLTGFPEGRARIWFAMHHLIVDGVSWRILCVDLERLYNGSQQLGIKSSSYKQWSLEVARYSDRNSGTEGNYWRSILSNVQSFNENLVKQIESSDTFDTTVEMCTVKTNKLLMDCPTAYNTSINTLLLTALGYALKEVTGLKKNFTTMEGHGREDISEDYMDISRTVGWFTIMYPVLMELGDNLRSSIMIIEEHYSKIPHKGLGYGAIIGLQDESLPLVTFNYLGRFAAPPQTKNNKWRLTDGEQGVAMINDSKEHEVIVMNGLCMKGQLQFSIHSRLDAGKTKHFANTFKSVLEDIVDQCITCGSAPDGVMKI